MRKILLILICFFSFGFSYGQNKYQLRIISAGSHCFQGKTNAEISDSTSLVKFLFTALTDMHAQGFLTASFDSVVYRGKQVEAFLFCGERYQWVSLRKGDVPENYLHRSGFRERFFIDKPFLPYDLVKLEKGIIREAENAGYPFARVYLDSIFITGSGLKAKLGFDAGPLYYFDSIHIEGPMQIKNSYLMRHLRISQGEPFSQEKYEEIPSLLKKLPYLQESRPASLELFGDKARIILYLKPRRVNQVDVLAGLLPNQGPEKKMIFTGEANLVLHNVFHSGKKINGHWRRFDLNSQILELGYFHPKIFGSFVDIALSLDLLKQDTNFITVNRDIYLAQQSSRRRIYIGLGRKTSRTLTDFNFNVTDYTFTSYTIGFNKEQLDDPYFPRSGWIISGEGRLGNKKILNASETDNDIPEESMQATWNVKSTGYLRLNKRMSFVASVNAASVLAEKSALFLNDLFRLGGLKTLRGFNENFYYAASYAVGTAEIRLYPDDETFLFLFFDQGYIFNPFSIIRKEDTPFGTGAGISFSSNAGIFSFAWSLGKSNVQPLAFNNSKIHFGYIARF